MKMIRIFSEGAELVMRCGEESARLGPTGSMGRVKVADPAGELVVVCLPAVDEETKYGQG